MTVEELEIDLVSASTNQLVEEGTKLMLAIVLSTGMLARINKELERRQEAGLIPPPEVM